jgi:NADH dehydrogenase
MDKDKHQVVIIGGGFGGLYAARRLNHKDIRITLIDKHNYHLFQPLLYQVATGALSPADIATPLRRILGKQKDTTVILDEAVDFDPAGKKVILKDGEISYDSLIVATGSTHHYFGNDQWEKFAPGLKTIEDATEIRGAILRAFEKAEKDVNPDNVKKHLTFVIVGGGPTGVELAGALREIAGDTLKRDFRRIKTGEARIILVEGMDEPLPAFPRSLSARTRKALLRMGIEVRTGCLVTRLDEDSAILKCKVREREDGYQTETIHTSNIIWAAGVKASPLGVKLAQKTGCQTDKAGRVIVQEDLSLQGFPDIFVIGDLARCRDDKGEPLPGLAPVARQQGKYVARLLKNRLKNKKTGRFRYINFGVMATIGRSAAVVNLRFLRFTGFLAWLFWLFLHLMYIVEFENRLLVFVQWAWNYFTRNRSARLITDYRERG